jgi:hypothetical protein
MECVGKSVLSPYSVEAIILEHCTPKCRGSFVYGIEMCEGERGKNFCSRVLA